MLLIWGPHFEEQQDRGRACLISVHFSHFLPKQNLNFTCVSPLLAKAHVTQEKLNVSPAPGCILDSSPVQSSMVASSYLN